MNKKLKSSIAKSIAIILITCAGGYMIGDWKAVAGVWLLMWANNICQHSK